MNEKSPADKNIEVVLRRQKFAKDCEATLEGDMTPEELAKMEGNQMLAKVWLELKETGKLPGVFGARLDEKVQPLLDKMSASEDRIAEKAAAKVLERLPTARQTTPAKDNKGLLYAILAVQAAGLAWMVLAFIFR
jgi:hypothetical protein